MAARIANVLGHMATERNEISARKILRDEAVYQRFDKGEHYTFNECKFIIVLGQRRRQHSPRANSQGDPDAESMVDVQHLHSDRR